MASGYRPPGSARSIAYRSYCAAQELLVSPAWTDQSQASQMMDDLIKYTNAEWVFTSGKLSIVPRGDVALSANGSTYTPPSPLYSLGDDDFIYKSGEDPVKLDRKRPSDQFNVETFEFNNRYNYYNRDIVEAKDEGAIDLFGLRPDDTQTTHFFCDPQIASTAAWLYLYRQQVRNTYSFRLGWKYILLDPMDIVEITDANLGLVQQAVRILEIQEDEDGTLQVTAEDYLQGTGTAAKYSFHPTTGFQPNYNQSPGAMNPPLIFEAPLAISVSGNLEVWLALSGQSTSYGGCDVWVSFDNSTYAYAGRARGSARQGVLTSALLASPTATDDMDIISVGLLSPGAQLLSGSSLDALLTNTACWVDGEIISYTTAQLTAGPGEGSVTAQSFGTGNGVTTAYQLVSAPSQPISATAGAPAIYKSDWQGNQLQYSTARSNLLKYSQSFGSSPWSGSHIAATSWSGGSAPDGTATAEVLTPNATSVALKGAPVTIANDSSSYLFSAFVNSASVSAAVRIQHQLTGGTTVNAFVNFDPATGTIISTGSVTASGVVSYPNGWYLIWGVCANNSSGNTTATFGLMPDESGSTEHSAVLWGAQFTNITAQGLPATGPTSYIKTTAAAVTVTDYTITASGVVAFANAPAQNAALTWTGSYEAAALNPGVVPDNYYALSGLQRGQYGTTNGAHAVGAAFARLDKTIFPLPFPPAYIGAPVWLKLLPYNQYGGGQPDLASVQPYSFKISGTGWLTPLANVINLAASAGTNGTPVISWSPVTDPLRVVDYEVRFGASWQTGQVMGRTPNTNWGCHSDGTFWVAAHSRSPQGVDVYSAVPASVLMAYPTVPAVELWSETEETGTIAGVSTTLPSVWPWTLGGSAIVNKAAGAYDLELDLGAAAGVSILAVANVLTDADILWGSTLGATLGSVSGTYGVFQNFNSASLGIVSGSTLLFVPHLTIEAVSIYDNVLTCPSFLGWADVFGNAIGSCVSAILQVAIAASGGAPAWQPWSPGKTYYNAAWGATYPQLQLVLTTTSQQVRCVVTHFQLDAYAIDYSQSVHALSIPAGGADIVFPFGFSGGPASTYGAISTLPFISVTIDNAQSGDTVAITSASLSGFYVQVLNGGVGVARTIDWTATGY